MDSIGGQDARSSPVTARAQASEEGRGDGRAFEAAPLDARRSSSACSAWSSRGARDAVDATGEAIGPVAFFGARSARHLDPMPENWCRQEGGGNDAATNPVRVPVRLSPTDYLVPKGGRLTVGVGLPYLNRFPSSPSGAGTTVRIRNDCANPSALRFFLPNVDDDLISVREPDEGDAPLASHPARRLVTDGAGLATPRCAGRSRSTLSAS